MRIRLFYKVLTFSMLLILVAAGISSIIAYNESKSLIESHISKELSSIVKTAAPFIDGDLVELIHADTHGVIENEQEFEILRETLVHVKQSNDLSHKGSPLYLLRKAFDFQRSADLEFVVMTDRDEAGQFFVGNRYPTKPHLEKAFEGQASTTSIYYDDEGIWISAAVPIRNSVGEIIAVLQADREVHYYLSIAKEQAIRSLFGVLISVLFAGIFAVYFSRGIVRPIEALTNSTEIFGKGNFDHRIKVEREDEIGDLALGFNSMAEQVQTKSDEMLKAQRLAEQASFAKSEFLANMSHEIRTPLNAITSLTRLLQYSTLDEEQSTDVSTIQSCAHSLTGIINDILDFSKIEAGKIALMDEPFSPKDSTDLVTKQLDGEIRSKHQVLVVEFSEEIPETLIGDAMRLEQILRNLLANAIKFTPEQGGVILFVALESSNEQDAVLRFSISDSGIGVAKEKVAKIFDAFAQAEESTTKTFGGTGLGLAICVRLVKQLGGELSMESREGVGSCFTFTVRLGLPETTSEVKQKHALVNEATIQLRTPDERKVRKGKVLLVEDNPINQDTISRVLTLEGYDIELAHHGKEACSRLLDEVFDIVLMDLHMPVMGGLEATTLIRAAEQDDARVPIIALTAHAINGVREECFSVGMNAFVEKPIEYDKLLRILDEIINAKTEQS